jgi:hypothetical protein
MCEKRLGQILANGVNPERLRVRGLGEGNATITFSRWKQTAETVDEIDAIVKRPRLKERRRMSRRTGQNGIQLLRAPSEYSARIGRSREHSGDH